MFPYNFKNRSKFSQKTVKVREFLIILGSFIPLNSITITFYQKIECEYCFQAINLDEGNLSYTLSLRYTCRRYYLVVCVLNLMSKFGHSDFMLHYPCYMLSLPFQFDFIICRPTHP